MCTISKSIHCIKIMISRYARYNWGFALDRNSTCSFCTEDRFSGFLSNANLVNFTAFAFLAADSTFSPFLGLPGFLFSEGPTLELVAANVLRRTFSSASIAQETTWKGSMQRCALGQYSLIQEAIQRAPSAVIQRIDALCSSVRHSMGTGLHCRNQ